MKKLNNFFGIKTFKVFLITILVYSMLSFQSVITITNPISWLLLLLLFVFFSKVKLYDKNYNKTSIILSLTFSFLIIIGKIFNDNMMNKNISLLGEFFNINNLISYIGLTVLFYVILINIFDKLINANIMKKENFSDNSKKVLLISFIIIMICWLPYFLALYPGELSSDSIAELKRINGITPLSNHHPVIHLLFIFIPYKIGNILFNNVNMAVALCSLLQMIIMALIFSSFINFLYKRRIKKIILIFCLIFFSLVPMHAFYSITMWKDIIFSGTVLLLTMQLIKLYELKNEINFKKLIWFIIISLLTLFFRNNAIYMYFILIVFVLFIFKDKIKYFLVSFAIIIGTYFIVLYPVFNILNISRSSSAEYIAIPLQQVGRMVYKGVNLTTEEKNAINDLIDIEVLKEVYHPYGVDNIKFNKAYNGEVFDKNKLKYFKLWFKLVIKHPYIAIESYGLSTLGYWYPGVDNWVVCNGVYENDFGIHRNPKGLSIINYIVNKMDSRDIPVIGMFWSTSLAVYLIIISMVVSVKKHGKKLLLFYIPVFGIWLTMMIAAPVNGEFRYIYPLYTCLPLLLCLPYIIKDKKRKIN